MQIELSKDKVDISLSLGSGIVIFRPFSAWCGPKIIAGVVVTAGLNQFKFYLGGKQGELITHDSQKARKWGPYDRKKVLALNTEMEKKLKSEFETK